MNYIEYKVDVSEQRGEVILASLADMGFDSFLYDEEAGAQLCYIEEVERAKYIGEIEAYFAGEQLKYSFQEIETQNWNESWESSFEPIVVDSRLGIRAPFHAATGCEREVVITPNMSFGTGHHATTYQLVEWLLSSDFSDKRVLDMGCGSAILAIVAAMQGSKDVVGVDIDEWAVHSARENVEANGYSEVVELFYGDAELLERLTCSEDGTQSKRFDVVLANINRNILCNDMARYRQATEDNGGELLCSGFYTEDIDAVVEAASKEGYCLLESFSRDNWAMLHFKGTFKNSL